MRGKRTEVDRKSTGSRGDNECEACSKREKRDHKAKGNSSKSALDVPLLVQARLCRRGSFRNWSGGKEQGRQTSKGVDLGVARPLAYGASGWSTRQSFFLAEGKITVGKCLSGLNSAVLNAPGTDGPREGVERESAKRLSNIGGMSQDHDANMQRGPVMASAMYRGRGAALHGCGQPITAHTGKQGSGPLCREIVPASPQGALPAEGKV